MSATAARLVETSADIDTESDDSDNEQPRGHAGNLNLVRRTLQGIASHDTEEGRVSFGRHDACIKMGRDLWATEELTATERWQAAEVSFVEGTSPAAREALQAAAAKIKLDNGRPVPFADRTRPYAHLSLHDYSPSFN